MNDQNTTLDQTDSQSSNDTIHKLIDELSINFSTVPIDLSLSELASCLQYMACADAALGEGRSIFPKEAFFGRGVITRMLADCVTHFDEAADKSPLAIEKLHHLLKAKQGPINPLADCAE